MLELVGIVHRQGSHEVEGALGALTDDAGDLGQLGHHGIPAALVLLAHGGKVLRTHLIQGSGSHLVQGRHGEAGLAVFHGLAQQLMVAAEDAAHSGAAGGEPLGDGVDDDDVFRSIGILPEGLQGLAGVDELPVSLVPDEEEVVLLGDVAHQALLLRGEDHAGGVAGIGAHNGPGVFVDLGLDLGPVGIPVPLFRRGGDGVDAGAGGVHHGAVVGVEGLGDQDLVSVVQDALEDDGQCLRTTGGDEDLILFKVHVQFIIIGLDGVDQFRYPRGRGVLQDRGLEVTHCLKELRRGLHVGLADVQMIDLAALGFRCDCVGVELPHRGQTALLYFARKLHVHTSGFSYLRVESGIALTLLYVCMDEKSIAIQDKNGEDFRGMSIPRGKGGKPLW